MPRGQTFAQVVLAARQESGHSTSAAPGRNVADLVEQTVRRVYERLHQDYDWPHLSIRRDIPMEAGFRFYNFPSDLDPDRTGRAWILEDEGTHWRPVEYGIGPAHWNAFNPERDERTDPVRAWQRYEGGMIEVWPTPLTAHGTLRLEGLPYPNALVEDSAVVDLDSNLIALYAAGEILQRQNSTDAQLKLEQAQTLYNRLKSNSQRSNPVFALNRTRGDDYSPVTRVRAPR